MKKLEFNIKQILIVLIILLLVLNGVKMIKKQKNTTISINATALDNYGYLEDEEFKLEANETEDNLYEIELPETINEKVVAQTINVYLQDDTIIEMKENKIVLTKEQLQNNKLTLEVEYDTTGEETSIDNVSTDTELNIEGDEEEEISLETHITDMVSLGAKIESAVYTNQVTSIRMNYEKLSDKPTSWTSTVYYYRWTNSGEEEGVWTKHRIRF